MHSIFSSALLRERFTVKKARALQKSQGKVTVLESATYTKELNVLHTNLIIKYSEMQLRDNTLITSVVSIHIKET